MIECSEGSHCIAHGGGRRCQTEAVIRVLREEASVLMEEAEAEAAGQEPLLAEAFGDLLEDEEHYVDLVEAKDSNADMDTRCVTRTLTTMLRI